MKCRSRTGRLAVTLLLCAFAALAHPRPSLADCGGTETAQPAKRVAGQLPPLAIGDSTMLLSLPGLAEAGYAVNAHGCRQFYQALQLLAQLKAGGQLPHMVVIALGANCCISSAEITMALGLLTGHLLVLVTPRQLGGGSGENALIERQAASRNPAGILLLDWVAYSTGHPDWFQPDGLHLNFGGAAAFTALLATALPYAYIVPNC